MALNAASQDRQDERRSLHTSDVVESLPLSESSLRDDARLGVVQDFPGAET
jgi:hypothetical protein